MAKVFFIIAGRSLGCDTEFWQSLDRRVKAKRVTSAEECDVTLTFCPIVSRVGTDVEAAAKLIPATRPGVFVALHPTLDPDHVAADASRFVTRPDILTVSCLFSDGKLLNSGCNDKAFKRVSEYLMSFQKEIVPQQRLPADPAPPPPQNNCCDSILQVQHPRYLLAGLIVTVIVFIVIFLIVILTSV